MSFLNPTGVLVRRRINHRAIVGVFRRAATAWDPRECVLATTPLGPSTQFAADAVQCVGDHWRVIVRSILAPAHHRLVDSLGTLLEMVGGTNQPFGHRLTLVA